MNINLISIHNLLDIICFLFLGFNILNSSYKFIRKKKYTFFDFRISLFTLIFLLINLSFSFLLINKLELNIYISNAVTLFLCFFGWYLHNRSVDPRKKHFRILFFFVLGLITFVIVE